MITGRFAPSPTGPLHMGSLVTAVASYIDVKQQGGRWLVRIDDLDPPRQPIGTTQLILNSLVQHGLHSDAEIDYQSQHADLYQHALEQLANACFYCRCTRKSLAGQTVYPGTCRAFTQPREDSAIRLRVRGDIVVCDLIMGEHKFDLAEQFGDCIVRRRDGLIAYQLATAVDDGQVAISHVLRGQDLWPMTPVQQHIMAMLNLQPPVYTHIPVLNFASGQKLSKQAHAPALDNSQAADNVYHALYYLGLSPPPQAHNTATQWLRWGIEHWRRDRIPDSLTPFQPHRHA